jgi:hypothetical protein
MNIKRVTEAGTRREFLRGGVRYALAAGLGAVAAAVAGKPAGRLSGQVCVNEGLCRNCGIVDDCGLPQALSFKLATKGSGS